MMEPPPKITQKEIQQEDKSYFRGHVPLELRDNVKNIVFHALSLPAKNKKPILHAKLAHSEYVNKYLNKYVMIDNIAMTNDHLKFGMVYAMNLFETYLIDEKLLMKLDQKATETKPPPDIKAQAQPNPLDSLNPAD